MNLSVEEIYETIASPEDNERLQQKMEYCDRRFEKIDRIREYKLRRIRQKEHWAAENSIVKEHHIEAISRKRGVPYIAASNFKDWFIEFDENEEIGKELNEKDKIIAIMAARVAKLENHIKKT